MVFVHILKVNENAKGATNLTLAPLPKERHIDKSKLGLFSRYGFGQSNWEDLRNSLLEHAHKHPVSDLVASKFGTKYIVTGVLSTPSERQPLPIVTAVWQQDIGEVGVRLITAYPT